MFRVPKTPAIKKRPAHPSSLHNHVFFGRIFATILYLFLIPQSGNIPLLIWLSCLTRSVTLECASLISSISRFTPVLYPPNYPATCQSGCEQPPTDSPRVRAPSRQRDSRDCTSILLLLSVAKLPSLLSLSH